MNSILSFIIYWSRFNLLKTYLSPIVFISCISFSTVADENIQSVIAACEENESRCLESESNSEAGRWLNKTLILPKVSAALLAVEEGVSTLLDSTNRVLGQGLKDVVRRIDEFIADEKLYYDSSASFVRLRADSVWYERDESGFVANVRLRLKLPRSSEKYRFVFESEPDRVREELDSNAHNSPLDAADKQRYFSGLQAILGNEDRWRYRLGVGVKLRSPVDSYVRLGVRRIYPFSNWSLRLEQTAYMFDLAGKSYTSTLEINRRLAETLLFRSNSRARWSEENRYFETSQVFSLFQTLSKTRLFTFQAGVYGVTEPTILATEYRFSASFRQNLRKQYLFLELIPQLRYQKINGFAPEQGFILRLEWLFQG